MRETGRIALDRQPFRRHVDVEMMTPLLEERACHLDPLGDHLGQLDGDALEVHLPTSEPSDVEEIVY